MKVVYVALLALVPTLVFAEHEKEPHPPRYGFIAGGGASIKGFGETDQIVYTADVMFRRSRTLFTVDKPWLKGRHEMWIETPVAFIIHDSDDVDEHDVAIIGFTFLAVWVFPEFHGMEPYIFGGGGGRYLFADIEGMGNDINGNYQFGIGTYFLKEAKHPLTFDMRYDHISNGSTKEPNVPVNSVKILLGVTF